MPSTHIRDAEAERLKALHSYQVLDTAPDSAFDDIARLAAQVCGTRFAAITLIDADRAWVKSAVGFSLREARRQSSFSAHTVDAEDVLVVQDAGADVRFSDNPLVANAPQLRFYAGVPLRTPEGHVIGALSVYDDRPRDLAPQERDAVKILAEQVMAQLELRRVLRAPGSEAMRRGTERVLQEDTQVLETLARVGAELTAELDLDRLLQKITDAATELTGAQFGALFYNALDENGESYQLYTLSGVPQEAFANYPMPRATAVFAPTFRGEGVVRSADITKDPRYGKNHPNKGLPEGHLPVCSYLAVPVVSRSGEVIGGLFFGHSEPDMFTALAERLATGIAAQAAIAIDNARLYEVAAADQAKLEKLVSERTRQLQEANARLVKEIDERAEIEEALRQAQKMEAIGQLTGGVAHDFNNLLQVIGANLELLERKLPDEEQLVARLRAASNAVERGARLASQLLAFARRQPLDPKPINVGRLLKDMDELLRRALGEEVALETVVAGGLWNTFVDPAQVENAILNLAVNARDAMPEGGKLTIEASNAMLDDLYGAQHEDVEPGQYVMLAVSDTGFGMSDELIERVFEPFFTTKGEAQGTGLGLSMVYGFVKQSHGHIKIYSEPGQGTTVKLYLPRALQAEQAEPEIPTGPVERGTETILVAEDDPEVREAAVDMLSELGYRVLKAADGQDALVVLHSGIPVDLLFTDVVMPGRVRAPELARRAKEVQPDIAVLFTSGYTENAIVHGGRLDPGVDLLAKPYNRSQLARKVRHILRNREQRLAARQAVRDGLRPPSPGASGTEPLRVLLVEDDEMILETVATLISDLGHDVVSRTSGQDALAALRQGDFDVLFTDVGLPGLSGVELARAALEKHPTLRVVFASGYGRNIGIDDLPSANVVILSKPFDLDDVERTVQQLAAADVWTRTE